MDFKNEYEMNESLFVDMCVNTMGWLCAITTCFVAAIVSVCMWQWICGVLCLLAALILTVVMFSKITNAKSTYQKRKTALTGPDAIQITFLSDKVKYKDSLNSFSTDYHSLVKTRNTSKFIILKTDRGDVFGVKRDSFTEGALKDFKYKMQIKGFNVR